MEETAALRNSLKQTLWNPNFAKFALCVCIGWALLWGLDHRVNSLRHRFPALADSR